MNPTHALQFRFLRSIFVLSSHRRLNFSSCLIQVSRPKFCISFSLFLCASHSALLQVTYDHPNNSDRDYGYQLGTKLLIMFISHVQPWPTRCVCCVCVALREVRAVSSWQLESETLSLYVDWQTRPPHLLFIFCTAYKECVESRKVASPHVRWGAAVITCWELNHTASTEDIIVVCFRRWTSP